MLERSKAHEVGIWKRRFERAEEILQQLRPKAEQYDHISRVLDQEQLNQLLSQCLPTHEPTTHDIEKAIICRDENVTWLIYTSLTTGEKVSTWLDELNILAEQETDDSPLEDDSNPEDTTGNDDWNS